jgi:predicted AlkP superfamily pyrophosphatase or phosphodiesterase
VTTTEVPAPVLPDYGGACISSLVPHLLDRRPAAWLPDAAIGARQVVVLVLDGLGWEQLRARPAVAPVLFGAGGGPITTVAPSTTATALTSITTGLAPAAHGVVGYRMRVAATADDGSDEVLNVLRWRTASGDAVERVPPATIRTAEPFAGRPVVVVTRSEFTGTGFTTVHLGGTRLAGWRLASSLVVEVRRALGAGEPFVYAYYDGIDRVAHEYGLGEHYEAEVAAADRLVADLAAVLPAGAALVVTADHGQVDVGANVVQLDAEVLARTRMLSGEGRFRWLHTDGDPSELAGLVRAAHRDVAWVRTRREAEEEGWFGGPLPPAAADRLGDVAVVAHQPVSFADPGDAGEVRLKSRHGSLTSAEMYVPLVAFTG